MKPRAALLVLVFAVLSAARAFAMGQQVSVGVRAIGMGGAFTSIADDATSLYWNPAGLPWIGHQELSLTHANLYGAEINDDLASFILPVSPHHAVGADWYHSGFGDTQLDYSESRFDLGYGFRFHSLFSGGITAKYLTRTDQLNGETVRQGGGAGLDLGAMAQPIPRLSVGLLAQDITGTHIDYSNAGSALVYPHQFRLGASYRPSSWSAVAFDVDDRFHTGFEVTPISPLSLRAGAQWDRGSESELTWSTGIGLKAGIFRIDYANEIHPVLGTTHYFGVAMAFNFNPSQVRIESVEDREVYSSLYNAYATEPVAHAKVRNLSDQPLAVVLHAYIPELMTAPTDQKLELLPKHVKDVAVPVNLSPEKAMALPPEDGRRVHLDLSASYQSAHLPRTDRVSKSLFVYGPGAINWSEGVDQAAAYVTQQDPAVDRFAGQAAREAASFPDSSPVLKNIETAAAVFDALASCGIVYVADPDNPFLTVSEDPHSVDTVRYPIQTLVKLGGDCDDTTVLYAALLENVGIATRFVDGPGHIFLMFDSGVHERNKLSLCVDPDLTVASDQRMWVPVETTALKDGFATAWKLGAEQYVDWDRGRLETVVDVESSQTRYAPGQPPRVSGHAPEPNREILLSRLGQDMKQVEQWRSQYLSHYRTDTDAIAAETPEALEEQAHASFLAGRWQEARDLLMRAGASERSSARYATDMGIILAVSGDEEGAIASLESAGKLEPSDPGIQLDLGLTLLAARKPQGRAVLSGAVSSLGGYRPSCILLKMSTDAVATKQGKEPESLTQWKSALRAAAGSGAWPEALRVDDRFNELYWKK